MALGDTGKSLQDLPRRAEARLQGVMLDEGCLERVEFTMAGNPLYRRDLRSILHRSQREAGEDAAPADQDGTGAARALVAPLLGAGQVEPLAQHVEHRLARIDLEA